MNQNETQIVQTAEVNQEISKIRKHIKELEIQKEKNTTLPETDKKTLKHKSTTYSFDYINDYWDVVVKNTAKNKINLIICRNKQKIDELNMYSQKVYVRVIESIIKSYINE